eukprot:88666-Pyramimonas_sp.AAC.1
MCESDLERSVHVLMEAPKFYANAVENLTQNTDYDNLAPIGKWKALRENAATTAAQARDALARLHPDVLKADRSAISTE